MRILMVEDEKDLRETIAEGLTMDGYAVDTCGDGSKAYALLYVENYDLAISTVLSGCCAPCGSKAGACA